MYAHGVASDKETFDMYTTLPRPTISCSKCGSTDIAIPERDANGPASDDGATLLRCRNCGHVKTSGHEQRFYDLTHAATNPTFPKRETF